MDYRPWTMDFLYIRTMQFDYLIAGQGIAGTMLSHRLLEAGQRVLVIDAYKPNSASRIAAGVINPVSGRRFEMAWMYEQLYPFAKQTYRQLEQLLSVPVFKERDIWMALPSEQLRTAFNNKTTQGLAQQYTHPADAALMAPWLHQPYGAAIVKGATVLLHHLLPAWRHYLAQRQLLWDEQLDLTQLQHTAAGVQYKEVQARAIIFCEGAQIIHNPWFKHIPFLLNKGEVLKVRIPGLHTENILKKSITLVPQEQEVFWAGSTFVWDYVDEAPTPEKRLFLEESLQQLLKVPYTVLEQQAGIRPSGKDRRPIMGLHPQYPALGLFNGLGTKGCSLAPYMAHMLTQHLLQGMPLLPEADIKRYFNR
ncbi:MAG TPA: FAD-binding oxidoreductase [Chitinophaga sp.]|uniref:NAD(P)/FAD-dependent oxidoreductase n=1 Tax=Chitinophaga sp. TaxID=1869181 RepID=UPI002F91E7AB